MGPLMYARERAMQMNAGKKPMKLTPMVGNPNAIKNPYEDSPPSAAGMQEMQKPPVNLGPRAKPMYQTPPETDPGQPIAKPYQMPVGQISQDNIGQMKPTEEDYFAQNAERMKPMKADMYSMRRNRQADKFYQRQRINTP